MAYKCEILADSISEQGHRLTTFKLTYPRIIHAEMLRHRMLSRNVASSRAIPFEKMVKDVQEDPFIPIAWQKTHKGMQGNEYFTERISVDNTDIFDLKTVWLDLRDEAIKKATRLNRMGLTKQLCNRLLEPFVWTTELVSGTEWNNFFELRCPQYGNNEQGYFKSKKDALRHLQGRGVDITNLLKSTDIEWQKINKSQAEIHIQKIAEMMWNCYNESKPKTLQAGDWHIPFGDKFDSTEMCKLDLYTDELDSTLIKIATARAARISYTTLGDNPKIDYEADIKLHDRLLESHHMSPFEHCARVMSDNEYHIMFQKTVPQKNHRNYFVDHIPGWCNNYRGFIQYRYLIENQ